jgi:hypothetical protein
VTLRLHSGTTRGGRAADTTHEAMEERHSNSYLMCPRKETTRSRWSRLSSLACGRLEQLGCGGGTAKALPPSHKTPCMHGLCGRRTHAHGYKSHGQRTPTALQAAQTDSESSHYRYAINPENLQAQVRGYSGGHILRPCTATIKHSRQTPAHPSQTKPSGQEPTTDWCSPSAWQTPGLHQQARVP